QVPEWSGGAECCCFEDKKKGEEKVSVLLYRLNVEIDPPKKRPKISSSSEGPIKLQEASYSNDQIISQSPSSNGTKKDISKSVDFKLKDIKSTNVKSEFDHGIKNLSSSKIANDVKPKAESQANEKKWPHLLAQREKLKEFKKERNNKFRDSSEKYVLEKCKRNQFSQEYNSNKIIKEHFESRRRKISFKIPIKSCDSLQKLVEENVFNLDLSKSETKQEGKECPESSQISLNLTRHKTEHLFSDSTYKQTVHEWKGKYHHEHQESNDSNSSENLTQVSTSKEQYAKSLQCFDKLVLLIPWVVIQELDRMKAGKLLKHAQHKAIPAVRFISDSLKNKDGKLWGQSIQLASQKLYGLSDENNDDRVLKCCLQHQELFPCSVMLYLKPPWTLIHLLQCFKKHWLAVFGLVMEKNLLLTIESLYENLRNANNTVDFITVKFLLQDSKSLLHAFSTRSNYDGILPQAFAQVNKLLQTFAEVRYFCNSTSKESISQYSNHQKIHLILIYQVMDVFQRLGSNSALTTSKIASFEEAFVYLQKLMAAVKDILEGIQSSKHAVYNKYIQFLSAKERKKFYLSSCLAVIYHFFSPREKLTIGCCQLVEMEHTMQQCNASVYVEARNRGWCEDVLNYRT
uniref:SWT1 RNA endoribonuclease homolog n=1 Tax=Propithecus coquereli TaxID=379532 RepID=A0A2K6FGR1_PROCO